MALGLSLDDMARLAGVEPSLLAAMESGDAPITPALIAILTGAENAPRDTVNSTQRPS